MEILLHGMIHTYLHFTKKHNGDGHGPEFQKHMNRLNRLTGANITVYHTLNDALEAVPEVLVAM